MNNLLQTPSPSIFTLLRPTSRDLQELQSIDRGLVKDGCLLDPACIEDAEMLPVLTKDGFWVSGDSVRLDRDGAPVEWDEIEGPLFADEDADAKVLFCEVFGYERTDL